MELAPLPNVRKLYAVTVSPFALDDYINTTVDMSTVGCHATPLDGVVPTVSIDDPNHTVTFYSTDGPGVGEVLFAAAASGVITATQSIVIRSTSFAFDPFGEMPTEIVLNEEGEYHSDSDGILDGEEMKIWVYGEGYRSHPGKIDTDEEGLTDDME